MPSNTYTLIASSTVGGAGAASITLSSIPSTYYDLCLKVSARSNTSRASNGFLFDIRPNGSTANMTRKSVYGDGSSSASSSGTEGYNQALTPSDATANTFSSTDIYICNYAGSTSKAMSTDTVSENNGSDVLVLLGGELWSSSTAISSITLTPLAGSFVQYTTAYLYGIAKS